MSFRLPVAFRFRYTSGFHDQRPYGRHGGIDLAPYGSDRETGRILAAGSGRVVRVAVDPDGYGNYIDIDHGGGLLTRYAHLSRVYVRPGMSVGSGQAIGVVGSTGYSTGPHLHFEIRRNGVAVDPIEFFRRQSDTRGQASVRNNLPSGQQRMISRPQLAQGVKPSLLRYRPTRRFQDNQPPRFAYGDLVEQQSRIYEQSVRQGLRPSLATTPALFGGEFGLADDLQEALTGSIEETINEPLSAIGETLNENKEEIIVFVIALIVVIIAIASIIV